MTVRLTRTDAEDFLYHEARLLDEWSLAEWADLFDEDGEYLIPPTEAPDGDPSTTLFLVYDDRHRLTERAKRLLKRNAHAEFPRSRVQHMITNVQVEDAGGEFVRVRCTFLVHRSRSDDVEVFPGHAVYDLRVGDGGAIRIRRKRAVIDTDSLRGQRRISIIL